MLINQDRRAFLAGVSAALVGATGYDEAVAAAEPAPETTTVRLPQWIGGAYCWAAEYIAGKLLRAEGIEVQFVQGDPALDQSIWIANGETDLSINYVPIHVASIDAGVPVKVLTGLHSGCLELIANDSVQSIVDLRGKRVGVSSFYSSQHMMLTVMANYIGLDPANDIEWVTEQGNPTKLFINGEIDAFLSSPPWPQELRAQNIGHTVVSTTTDKPWSQHLCCMICGDTDYVNRYPVATKRILRGILKAADICASDPAWVARELVDRGFVPRYDLALQTLNEIRYDTWREFDPEDSLRFHALRMHEMGMIKSRPQEIIAKGTDWRFLDELRRELKV
jgi:NitT/TauT family transport system substrate-binding protein